jgi:DNA mismatch repair protein MutS
MTDTPLMQQYREIKARHQDAILFFRMGDFYEMFYEDAETGARALGLTLTSRNSGAVAPVPLAGVPVKAVSEYVRRLVRQGFRVAICEQLEDPKLAKGPVRRGVIETVTPGAVFADDLLDGARNNFLCAISGGGIAAADVSTGEFRLAVTHPRDAGAVLARFAPREVLIASGTDGTTHYGDGVLVTEREPWEFEPAHAHADLARQFHVTSLDAFGIGAADDPAVGAAGALLRYLRELQPGGLPHLARPVIDRPGGIMPLDEMTRRNLELIESLRGGETANTLLDVLDRTATPMGARLLRQWLLTPLTDRARIEARLDQVEALTIDALARAALRDALDGVRDVERLAGKAAAGRATPRELRALGDSMARLPAVAAALHRLASSAFSAPLAVWDGCDDLAAPILHSIVAHPPAALGEDATIAAGVDPELDALRDLRDGGKDKIAEIQAAERTRTGIASLKVGYNRVFGYFIEITNANKDAVPADYQRRQTLTGAERYVTPALKEYEERVLTAAERIEALERTLFEALRARTGAAIVRLQAVSRVVAELDVVATFAEVAERERYVRPTISDTFTLEIVGGRHPVVERMMPRDQFIPNDVHLDEHERVIILTGPNMAGKSTILRQIGLIVLMAQTGSFVPATRASIGIADRLFTRVGASDNLVRGQSTFMVEMTETSAILHTATARSLVLLDEIGRGTSTYDGVSIAWAVSEHLHSVVGCKTIFATHYHELTQLADELAAVRNFTVAVREAGESVLFLHRMVPGGADRSYGIEVGRLAGLPAPVLARAREVLRLLESEQLARPSRPVEQLTLFAAPHPLVARLQGIDINTLTPLQALTLLAVLTTEARSAGNP